MLVSKPRDHLLVECIQCIYLWQSCTSSLDVILSVLCLAKGQLAVLRLTDSSPTYLTCHTSRLVILHQEHQPQTKGPTLCLGNHSPLNKAFLSQFPFKSNFKGADVCQHPSQAADKMITKLSNPCPFRNLHNLLNSMDGT